MLMYRSYADLIEDLERARAYSEEPAPLRKRRREKRITVDFTARYPAKESRKNNYDRITDEEDI